MRKSATLIFAFAIGQYTGVYASSPYPPSIELVCTPEILKLCNKSNCSKSVDVWNDCFNYCFRKYGKVRNSVTVDISNPYDPNLKISNDYHTYSYCVEAAMASGKVSDGQRFIHDYFTGRNRDLPNCPNNADSSSTADYYNGHGIKEYMPKNNHGNYF